MEIEKLLIEKGPMEELYTAKNPLVRYIHLDRLKRILKLISKKKNLKILDAGCGEGQLLEMIAKRLNLFNPKLYGADITKVALENAKKRTNAKLSLQDLTNLNYKDESFDIITCTEVLEHIPKYKKVLVELKRILKKDGLLIISFPNEPLWTIGRFFLGRKPIKEPEHVNSFSQRKIIKEVGLKAQKKVHVPFRLPYFLALTRILVFKK